MDASHGRTRRVPPAAIASFLFVIGAMGTRPLVPLYAVKLDLGPAELGMLVSLYALIPLMLATVAGIWMDRNGMGRALVWSALIGGLALMLPFAIPGRAGLYVSQLLAGCGFTVFVLAAQNISGRGAKTAWERERSVAVFSLGVASGSLVGPLIGGFVGDVFGYGWGFLLLGAISVSALVVALPLMAGDRPTGQAQRLEEGTPLPLRNPLRVLGDHPYMGRAFLVSSLILIGRDMYVAYFPVYAIAGGMSASWIGVVIALHNGGGVIMRFAMLRLVGRLGKNRVIISSVLFSGFCFMLLPLTHDLVLLAVISAVLGMGLGIGQPLSISRTINLAPPERVGEVLGFRLACNRLTQFVTPLAVGGLALATGVAGIFPIVGAVLVVGCTRLSVPNAEEHPVSPTVDRT